MQINAHFYLVDKESILTLQKESQGENRAWPVWKRAEGQRSCGAECKDSRVARNEAGRISESQIVKSLVCHTN